MSTPADDTGDVAALADWFEGRSGQVFTSADIARDIRAAAAKDRAEADKLRATLGKVRVLMAAHGHTEAGAPVVEVGDLEEALSAADPVSLADVRTEWGVDLGFTIARVQDEEQARRWIQSYVDHPSGDDPKPVAVRRTVTTSAWAVNPHG